MMELKRVTPPDDPLGPGLTLRGAEPCEVARVIDFEAQFAPWPAVYRDAVLRWERMRLAPPQRWLFLDRDALVASAQLSRGLEQGDVEGGLAFRVCVALTHRQRGLGTRLLAIVEESARAARCAHLVTTVNDEESASVAFASRRGYREFRRQCRWQLAISRARTRRFPPAGRICRDAGLELLTFDQFRERHDDAILRFATAHRDLLGEQPRPIAAAPLNLAAYETLFLSKPHFEPEATFVVLHRERIVGLSLTQRVSATAAQSAITGVTGYARARRIGLALKLAVIAAAPALDLAELFAINDVDNAPTLRILPGLGYVPMTDLVRYRRDLSDRPTAPAISGSRAGDRSQTG